ncbi:MAG: HAD hydrolase-like protein [Acidobacteria bacterium]|nr:HAD hydrolase-like protein [Acidobacteriota bacterium]
MFMLVVFDLDGTLVDSREDLAASTNDVLIGLGADPLPTPAIVRMVGEGARTLVHRALVAARCDADLDAALAAFHQHYARRLLDTTRPYPGIDAVLDTLSCSTRLAVLTNKPLVPTQRLLDHFGWTPRFGRVIGGDGPWERKPDPAGLQDLMAWADATPGETLMVADSMVDVEVARRAGATICVAAWGFGHTRGDLTLHGDELVAQAADDILMAYSRGRVTVTGHD